MKDENRPSRRAVLAGATTLTAGLEVLAYARPARASAAIAECHAHIDAVVRDVATASRAFDDAIAHLEASLPRLHPGLVWRRGGRLPHSLCSIERRFDGEVAERGLDLHGRPGTRYLALPRLIEAELQHPTYRAGKGWRRFLRQTLRRSRRYQARLALVEEASIDAERAMSIAKRRLGELVEKTFAKPSTTQNDIELRAHALVAFSGVDADTWRRCQAGAYGERLASDILAVSPGNSNPRT